MHKSNILLKCAVLITTYHIGFTNDCNRVYAEDILSYSTNSCLRSGLIDIDKRQWSAAITNIERYLQSAPNDANAYEALGCAYFGNGDFGSAETNYTKAIAIAPDVMLNYLNRGNLYRAKQEYEKAVADFTRCIVSQTTNSVAYEFRASAYSSLGQYRNAIKDYTTALRFTQNNADVFVMRGLLYEKNGQFGAAALDYSQAIAISTNDADAYNDLAWLRATCPIPELRSGTEAIKSAMTACELSNWEKWEYMDTLAAAYAENADFSNAVRIDSRAVNANNITDKSIEVIRNHITLFQQRKSITR